MISRTMDIESYIECEQRLTRWSFEKEMKNQKDVPKWITKTSRKEIFRTVLYVYTFILCDFTDVAVRENIDFKSIVLHLELFVQSYLGLIFTAERTFQW